MASPVPTKPSSREPIAWMRSLIVALIAVASATMVRLALGTFLDLTLIFPSYFVAISVVALVDRTPGVIMTTILGLIAAIVFVFGPGYTPGDPLDDLIFGGAATITMGIVGAM